jgi:hypothetical protein
MIKQIWIGGIDAAGVLSEIGNWHIGSNNHHWSKLAVDYLLKEGLVSYRTHYAPAIPQGSQAFEVTDRGLDKLRAWGWDAEAAARSRQWYRDNVVKFGPMTRG